MNFVRLLVCIVALSGCAQGAVNHNVLAELEKLKPGMTRAEVTALLGEPHTTVRTQDERVSTFYRLLLMEGASATSDTRLLSDIIRCDFEKDTLKHVAGTWPKPERPAAETPKQKIMLVDSCTVYDRIALTQSCNATLMHAKAKFEAWVQAANADGNKLVAAYSAATKERDRAKVNTPERTAAEAKAQELLALVHAKQIEIKDYKEDAKKQLERGLMEYRAVRLPQLSDALLAYQKAHGYAYVYEIKQNLFSPETKPMFVSGVDVTDDVVKWIDSGGAAVVGLQRLPEKQSSAQE